MYQQLQNNAVQSNCFVCFVKLKICLSYFDYYGAGSYQILSPPEILLAYVWVGIVSVAA